MFPEEIFEDIKYIRTKDIPWLTWQCLPTSSRTNQFEDPSGVL
jgi:hypothetical protein